MAGEERARKNSFIHSLSILSYNKMEAARAAMIAKRFGGNTDGARIGGKGSVRQKAKGQAKSGGEDKKLSGVLKKMQMQPLKVEEVNIFKNDGNVIHVTNPKIMCSQPCNTYQISGTCETKNVTELLPGIISQLGPESMERLREYANEINAAGGAAGAEATADDSDDDEVPELVENFEEAATE